MKAHEPGSPQHEGVVGVAPEEEAEDVKDDTASRATNRKASGTSQGAAVKRTAADGEPPCMRGKSSGTAQGAVVQRATANDEPPIICGKSTGTAQGAAVQPATAARGSEASDGAIPVDALQTGAAANGSDVGDTGTVGANVTKARMPGSPQQKEYKAQQAKR